MTEYIRVGDRLGAVTDAAKAVTWQVLENRAELDHGDFYDLGVELTQTAIVLEGLCRTLTGIPTAYGESHRLRDDAGSDPHRRLAEAAAFLEECAAAVNRAGYAAGMYQTAIGHISLCLGQGR